MILGAIEGAKLAWNVGAVGIAARSFARTPNGATSWNLAGSVVGAIGPDKIINALIRYSVNLSLRAEGLDKASALEMAELMQRRVPQDTSLLHSGIEAYRIGNGWAVEASAQRYSNTKDYARDVEFGTKPGVRGRRVASDDYYANPYAGRRGSLNDETGRRRRADDARRAVNRTHPGTAPQPYFLPSAREVLERRGVAMAGLSDAVAAGEDLT